MNLGDYVEWSGVKGVTHWDGVTMEPLRGIVVGHIAIPDCEFIGMPMIRTLYGDFYELERNLRVLKHGLYVTGK